MSLLSSAQPTEHDRTAKVFARIHSTRGWGDGESVSGESSSMEQTAIIRRELPALLDRRGIRRLLDAPCGDCHWIGTIDMTAVEYIGCDIVPALITQNRARYPDRRFERLNLISDALPKADLVLVRDCLVHLTFDQIQAAARNIIASGAAWLLTTHFPGRVNRDIQTGQWRPLDLTGPPFCWPRPAEIINEGCTQNDGRFSDKSLGLWNLSELDKWLSRKPSDMDAVSVAVIIPCHNYGHYLRECLDSVLDQTRPADEIVVVLDDCSDDSAEIAAQYRSRGVRSLNVRCCDPFLSRRAGYRATESEIVCFLDADDMLSTDYLAAGVDLFAKASVGIVTPALQVIGATTPLTGRSDTSLNIEETNTVTSAALVRREAVERSGAMLGFTLVHQPHEDWHFWRAVVRNGWEIADSPAFHIYRRHESNRSLTTAGQTWAKQYAAEVGFRPPVKTRLAMISPTACTGGLIVNTLHKMRAASRVEWTALILTDKSASEQASVDAVTKFCPIYGGQPNGAQDAAGIDRTMSVRDRIAEVASRCDAFYIWGNIDPSLVEPYRRTHAILTGVHGQGSWSSHGAARHANIADVIYCVSRACQRVVPRAVMGKTVVVHNGVDLRSLVPQWGRQQVRDRWGVAAGDVCVGFVGRISSEKNPLALATALDSLPSNYRGVYVTPHWSVPAPHAAGLLATIKATARARDLVWCEGNPASPEHADPSDSRVAMGDVYAGLDCLLVPSIEEGGPLVLLEAMACGLPVVVTPVGLTPELERQHGRLTVRIDHGATAQAIASAIREAIHPLNRAAVEHARELMLYWYNSLRLAADFERLVVDAVASKKTRLDS